MALNQSKVYEASNGFKVVDGTTDGPTYTGGPASPVGLDMPIGTYYIQNTATGPLVWHKWGANNNDWIQRAPMDFYNYAESVGQTTNTGTTFVTKVTLSFACVVSGNYKLNFCYRAYCDGFLAAGNIQIRQAGTNLMTHGLDTNANDGFYQYSKRVALTAGTTYAFDIQINETGGGTSRIFDSSIELFRVI